MSVKKIIIGLVVLSLLGGGGWWVYQTYFATNIAGVEGNNTTGTTSNEPLAQGRPNDADSDGILDADEKAQGLNPAEYDTDGDGLSDKAEIEQFKTDPKKADTDGDTFWDGIELMKGYNPLGPGRLPTSTKS